jgi:hypothetical protein
MPKRKTEADNSENIRVRVSQETRERCNLARLAGAHKRDAESSFFGYLLELGLVKYEKIILPIENEDGESGQNTNSLLRITESRFFELLPYFPENIKKQIESENLNWEQIKEKYGAIMLSMLYKAEEKEKRSRQQNRG